MHLERCRKIGVVVGCSGPTVLRCMVTKSQKVPTVGDHPEAGRESVERRNRSRMHERARIRAREAYRMEFASSETALKTAVFDGRTCWRRDMSRTSCVGLGTRVHFILSNPPRDRQCTTFSKRFPSLVRSKRKYPIGGTFFLVGHFCDRNLEDD